MKNLVCLFVYTIVIAGLGATDIVATQNYPISTFTCGAVIISFSLFFKGAVVIRALLSATPFLIYGAVYGLGNTYNSNLAESVAILALTSASLLAVVKWTLDLALKKMISISVRGTSQ
tara:strand:- start:6602 stop:6955 length:354 start_codon:yes stop_codon:yes gene_type:complete